VQEEGQPEDGRATPRRCSRTRSCPIPCGECVTGVTLRLDRVVDRLAETVEA
jgi:hypothetical protein